MLWNAIADMNVLSEKLLDLVRTQGLIRLCDLAPLSISRVSLTRAVRREQLEHVGRGLYGLTGRVVSAQGSLAEVARKVPKGIVCLLSALRFHNLTPRLLLRCGWRLKTKRLNQSSITRRCVLCVSPVRGD